MAKKGRLFAAWLMTTVASMSIATAAPDTASPAADKPVATVNGAPISLGELNVNLSRAARQTFYHGNATEERLSELRHKVLDEMIVERLLAAEAERRGITPDAAEVDARIKAYEDQYKDSQEWLAQRDRVVPALRERMLANSRKSRLEAQIRDVPKPAEAALKKFYQANLKSFTEPSRDHILMIMLNVDPASPKEVWEQARQEAARLRAKILAGESFAELAKLHSGDESAANGGDVGYLHRGMIAEEAQEAIDKMQPGELSEPVMVLQGYALFKLQDRTPEKVRTFDEVKERASDLYRRETGDKRWTELVQTLRSSAKIWLDESVVPPQKTSQKK